ncbi:protoporphyrinogen oxidase [Allobacillus sp. GCM10007491]|uniref:Coproporphyrinogen III oxidase n=1 Tax=Allobacillus saliphilus TaxID=2912308 RepID=A0A941HS30_9BACI|nr:protoporphyrinogen oxidase [Allobacillus saliphilus]MBR7552983.1 protoporphyrinogen oxidase [Allobacillus saliphilus]
MERKRQTVAILGGGITGLTAAYYLMKENLPVNIVLIEQNSRLGGKIRTYQSDGFTIERGPDSFLERKDTAKKLVEDLGLEHELIRNATGQAYILSEDHLHAMPKGAVMGIPTDFDAFEETTLISDEGKELVKQELTKEKMEPKDDLSVGEFFRYRLGDEVVDKLIHPLISGIYAGDIDRLSLQATFPQYYQLEQKYGSLIEALRKTQTNKASNKPKQGQFLTLKDGLGSLVDALHDEIKPSVDVMLDTEVKSVEKNGDRYQIQLDDHKQIAVDQILSTLPFEASKKVFNKPELFGQVLEEENTSVANVAMAFPHEAIEQLPEGTGFVVSRKGDYRITACTWTHKKWPHTTPEGHLLLRAYVGKPGDEEILQKSDDEIIDIAIQDLNRVFTIKQKPNFQVVTRWENAMPQYTVGHIERVNSLEKALKEKLPGVYVAGNSYRGVGLPDCMDQAIEAVNQIKTNHY